MTPFTATTKNQVRKAIGSEWMINQDFLQVPDPNCTRITMNDEGPRPQALLEHLRAALALSEEFNQPMTGYLVERAIDEVNASAWGFDPPLRGH